MSLGLFICIFSAWQKMHPSWLLFFFFFFRALHWCCYILEYLIDGIKSIALFSILVEVILQITLGYLVNIKQKSLLAPMHTTGEYQNHSFVSFLTCISFLTCFYLLWAVVCVMDSFLLFLRILSSVPILHPRFSEYLHLAHLKCRMNYWN